MEFFQLLYQSLQTHVAITLNISVRKPNYYFGIINSVQDATDLINRYINTYTWNPGAEFSLFFLNEHSDDDIKNVLLDLWNEFYIHNINIILVDSEFEIYTWFPYHENSNCSQIVLLHPVASCNLNSPHTGKMELQFGMLFPYKLTRNLNKCPLTFIAKIYAPFITEYNPEKREGIEILMMDVMMSKINGTISYRYPGMESWGYKEPNGNNLYHYFNYFLPFGIFLHAHQCRQ